jgi:hypothetical protein
VGGLRKKKRRMREEGKKERYDRRIFQENNSIRLSGFPYYAKYVLSDCAAVFALLIHGQDEGYSARSV